MMGVHLTNVESVSSVSISTGNSVTLLLTDFLFLWCRKVCGVGE